MAFFVDSRKSRKKILLLEGVHPGAVEALKAQGFQVELEKSAFQGDDLVRRAKGYHALGIRSKTKLTEEVLRQLPELETVGCFCIGTDQVALPFANSQGVPVFNAPYSNTRSVAELVLAEMVALSRRLTDRSAQMHRGVWTKSADGSNEVRGKVLGIIGYGHIGSQLSVLAESMGLHVLYYDIVKKLPLGNAHSATSMSDLLARADFVSLHVPDTQLTRNMMGAAQLRGMKRGGYLINASRGGVVDLSALADALKSGHLGGAAIDVFPKEPNSNKDSFVCELQELENVILTPHIGGSTQEAQAAIGLEVSESFSRFFGAGSTTGAVNFPMVDAGPIRKGVRILNVHENVPGVLGAVNNIISKSEANIVAQNLATDADIGYLVVDIEGEESDGAGTVPDAVATGVAQEISRLSQSLRTFLLS